MKKIIITIALALTLTGCSSLNATKNPEDVILVESSRVTITQADLDKNMSSIKDQLVSVYGDDYVNDTDAEKLYNEQQPTVLNQMLTEKVMREKAIDLNIAPTDEDINSEVTKTYAMLKSVYAMQDASDAELLSKLGYTLDQYKEVVKNQLVNKTLTNIINKDVNPVDEDEARKYYDDNKEYFKINKGMEIAQIKFSSEDKATEVYNEISNGKSFEDALAENNPDKVETNGYIGFIEYDSPQVADNFMVVIKDLKEGTISKPVSDKNGTYILKGIKARGESYAEFDSIKENLLAKLNFQIETDNFNAKIAEWGKELGIKTHTDKIIKLGKKS